MYQKQCITFENKDLRAILTNVVNSKEVTLDNIRIDSITPLEKIDGWELDIKFMLVKTPANVVPLNQEATVVQDSKK